MGANIARRLMRGGHEIVAFDATSRRSTNSWPKEPSGKLDRRHRRQAGWPRIFWVMLPAGDPTETTIAALLASPVPGHHHRRRQHFYKDDIRRAKTCAEKLVSYIDVGTSGGVWGWSAAIA